jgi:hypothetical protein
METVAREFLMRLLKVCPKVYVVTLNHNGGVDTIEYFESIYCFQIANL